MNNTKLTSVKLLKLLYERLKVITINKSMTFLKLTNRYIDLYLTDDDFKNKIELHDNLMVSGSNL